MRWSSLVALAVVALAAPSALADTVKLKNGDTLTGTITLIQDGKVTLKTEAAGDVTIALAQVDTLATDAPIKVELANGATFSGKATATGGGSFDVDADGVGKQTVSTANLASVNKPAKPPRKWSGSIVGSSTWTRGNTYTQQTALDLNAVNRGETDRLTFDGWYRSGRQKNQSTGVTSTTERRFGGALKYDYFMGAKDYWYAQTSAEKNAISAIDLRFVAGAGLGWQFLEDARTNFNAEAGLAWFSESYANGTSTVDDLSARAAFHLDHKITDTVTLFDDTEALKIFNGPRDYLVKTKGGFRENFTPSFFAQQWVEFYWDPTPAAGKRRQDVTYYLGIGWTF